MNKNLFKLLFEQEENSKKTPENNVGIQSDSVKARPSNDSVDDQIDALILRYETASMREKDSINESLQDLSLTILLEQEEEGVEEDPALGGEEDMLDEPEGSEDMTVKKPAKKQKVPPLDVDAFTNRVVRMFMNYKNLLDIEQAIVNRVKNFLDENYGDVYVNTFITNLERDHGIVVSEHGEVTLGSDEPENFAVGANPAGAGMSGGGA
jgi:hypothetical protein